MPWVSLVVVSPHSSCPFLLCQLFTLLSAPVGYNLGRRQANEKGNEGRAGKERIRDIDTRRELKRERELKEREIRFFVFLLAVHFSWNGSQLTLGTDLGLSSMAVPAASRVLLRSLLGIVLLVSAAFLMSEHMCAWRREPFAASGTGDYFDTGVDNGRPVIPSRSSRSSPASSPSPSPPPTRMSSLAAEQSRSHVQYEEHPRAARPGVRIIRPGELPQPANKDAPPAAPSPPSPPAVPSVEDDDDAAESNDDNAPEEPDSAVGDAAERGAGGEEVVIEPLPAECNGTLSEAQLQQGAQSGLTAARRRWAREAAATRAHIVLPEQVSQDKAYANEVQEVQDAGVDDDVVVVGPAWDSCMPSGCWRGASRSAVELQPECALAGGA